ncbi:thiamine diphosphokinase [Rhodovulum iodosum]|nr:thiamine diphosphokinase [Rhodovulum robiginosum]RSK37938.1 thiamine diphosphokinase [Rhodovulum robiginosum]
MDGVLLETSENVTLLGGGDIVAADLDLALARAPVVAAADGGADFALSHGHVPQAVIGDFDSISDRARAAIPPERQHPIAEQDSTDFDKCLRSIRAPLILGLGFLGPRLDHQLAALNTLGRRAGVRCVLVGPHDICFLCPVRLGLDLPVGTRLSLFPLGAVTGESRGLRWAIDGIHFAPGGRVGTSNRVVATRVELSFAMPRMLAFLPRDALDAVLRGLRAAEAADG